MATDFYRNDNLSNLQYRTSYWIPILFVLLLAAGIRSLQTFFFLFSGEKNLYSFCIVLTSNLCYFLYFLPLSLLAKELILRYPFQRTSHFKLIAIHTSVAVVSFFLHQTITLTIDNFLWNAEWNTAHLVYQFFNNPAIWIEIIVYGLFVLGLYLHDYQLRTREREMVASQLEVELMNSRLQELKNRLQPEFLLGTLDSIAASVRSQKFSRANNILSTMSDFLRETVYSSADEWTTIEKEIEFLQIFLELQSVQNGSEITLASSFDEITPLAKIPKFTIQPIVENILNFQTALPQQCTILIEGTTQNDVSNILLKIPLFSDGVQLDNIEECLEFTQKRLNTIFERAGCLTLEHSSDNNLFISIKIPNHSKYPSLVEEEYMDIKALIVDDEQLSREGIRIRLQEYPDISIIGECASGKEAIEMIDALKPDLVFLDIQMPEMNGFEVLQKIKMSPPPLIIFITAYDKFAVEAFEYHAFDYLLKPINDKRFHKTLNRVTTEMNHRHLERYSQQLQYMINEYLAMSNDNPQENNTTYAPITRIFVKAKDQIAILPVQDVEWIESAGDYVYIHTKEQKHLVRDTLASFESKLNPSQFVRIHRSTIVNIEKVRSFRPNESGDYDVFLLNGQQLKLSRNYRTHFHHLLQRYR